MNPVIKLLWATQDPEYQIIRSARVCWDSGDQTDSRWEPTEAYNNIVTQGQMTLGVPLLKVKLGKKDETLLRKIMANQHNACLRFADASFSIEGVSRVCSHQLVRIAHTGILQRSQRYCSEDGVEFVLPPSIGDNEEVLELNKKAQELYLKLMSRGVKEEDARYILPSSCATQLHMTSNFQGWSHFLKIRLAKKVQYETRLVAARICEQLYEAAPIVFEKQYELLDKLDL